MNFNVSIQKKQKNRKTKKIKKKNAGYEPPAAAATVVTKAKRSHPGSVHYVIKLCKQVLMFATQYNYDNNT